MSDSPFRINKFGSEKNEKKDEEKDEKKPVKETTNYHNLNLSSTKVTLPAEKANNAPQQETPASQPAKTTSPLSVQKYCPSCKEKISKDTVLCVNCGTNVISGERSETEITKVKKKKPQIVKQKRVGPMNQWLFMFLCGCFLAMLYFGIRAMSGDAWIGNEIERTFCKSSLVMYNPESKNINNVICKASYENLISYKPTTKEQIDSPTFVTVYCPHHKRGRLANGSMEVGVKPLGEKVPIKSSHKMTESKKSTRSQVLYMLFFGVLICYSANLNLMWVTYKEGCLWFLGTMFIPLVGLIFILLNFRKCVPSLVGSLVGFGLICTSLFLAASAEIF